MKVKRKSYLTIMAGTALAAILTTGCQPKAEPDTLKEDADVVAEVEAEAMDSSEEETMAEKADTENVIRPLYPLTNAEDALADGGYSVSFAAEDLTQNDDGCEVTVEVYEYDRYEETAIADLKVGDQIEINNEDITVESVEFSTESGYIEINGGWGEENGYNLCEDGGLYRTTVENDYPLYYSVGKVTIPLSEEAEFVDHSDFETEPDGIVYEYGEIPKALENPNLYLCPENTIITVRGEEIVQIICYWVP